MCLKNNVGCSSASVYKCNGKDENFFLKIEKSGGELHREYEVLAWLDGKLPVPKIKHWCEHEGFCYLLTSEIKGHMTCDSPEDTVCRPYETTVSLLAQGLKMLQSIEIKDCAFDNTLDKKLDRALYNIENDLVDMDDFEESNSFQTPMDLYNRLVSNKPTEELYFTHGDYCLPNIFIEGNNITGFIDLGSAGIADKWQDIALCVRSLGYNLRKEKEKDKYIALLFENLRLEPDWEKINYYILLDELF